MQNYNPEIVKNVKVIISQALKVDESKVTPHSSLVKDLGAESIDFLDIVFRLEKTFKIKIPKGELFPEKLLTDARFVKEGKIMPAGLEELQKKIPDADWAEFLKNPTIANLGDIFTVGMIVDYLSEKLAPANK
ncbi:MAG: acyl carrier protein [Candidatus Omnitrophica bacterium CG07_land_8_20_14_0_80_50_8]|nr:MAG: acyl carrier protein [Candidatus Omnitrophica bacterium CG07_land_8_20_14_0_80_50_8]